MTTFTVEVKDSDAEIVLTILKKFKAKVKKESRLTAEISNALREVRDIQEGKIQPLSLNDI